MTRTSTGRWPALGDRVDDLETPTLLLREPIYESNLRSFAAMAAENGVSLRPHVKAHRIPALARRQTDVCGSGIMVQKLSLAEVMVRNGLEDVVVVCPVVTESKLRRLQWIARQAETVSVVVDGRDNASRLEEGVRRFGSSVNVTVELDVGGERTGIDPGDPAADLVEFVHESECLEFDGLLAYDNHVLYGTDSRAEFVAAAEEVVDSLETTTEIVNDRVCPVDTVRAGTTGTSAYMCQQSVVTELNPGRFLLHDTSLIEFLDDVGPEDCAARVLTTVVSRPSPDRAVVDAGAKSISWTAHHMPRCVDDADAEYVDFASEHGIVDVGDASIDPPVGSKLEFIVGNIDGAINLQDHVVSVVDDEVRSVWNVPTHGQTR